MHGAPQGLAVLSSKSLGSLGRSAKGNLGLGWLHRFDYCINWLLRWSSPNAVVKYPVNKAANDEVTLYPVGEHVGVTWLFSGNALRPLCLLQARVCSE
jgi:hypothetical protein